VAKNLPIELSVERDRGRAWVVVAGEIDLATADSVREVLRAELDTGAPVLVDLAACTFIDSVGLSVLIEAANTASNGREPAFGIVAPSPEVRRLIELIQLDSLIPVFDSATEAADHLGSPPEPAS
jgi:anti-sigma B factor antagonist